MRRIAVALLALASIAAFACKSGNPGPGPGPTSTGKGLPSSMAALGDSITAGFASCLLPQPCHRNSWSTGDGSQTRSHYQRIRAANPAIDGRAWNLSVSGSRASGLNAQAQQAVAKGAQYVTIQIGANDACRPSAGEMTSPEDFRAQVDTALRTLKQGLPNAKVFVASMPDLYRLWEIGHTNQAVVRVWGAAGVCRSMLANPVSQASADRQRRNDVRDRVRAFNRALSAVCSGYGRNCDYDGGAVSRYDFTVSQLSPVDFFHPNQAGQDTLAEITWKAGPYR
ncbi:SGNH/GDSL hydrolase family protein [Longispora albida]|uniref:SGNH/GDSL hydrolase family protein n=1 Tax=Longispora albida TaxID=203523 RepID=UPI0003A38F36|nr:SGNH/GDSL hydrolase family protein [Longispora albida]